MQRKVYQTRSSNTKVGGKDIIWTREMDHFLATVLVDHAKDNYKLDGAIKPTTYATIINALNVKFGLQLTKDDVKSHLKTLRKQSAILKEIISRKGFRWDKSQKMVVANDAAWKEYIKINPDVQHFCGKVIENYDALHSMGGNDQTITKVADNIAEIYVDLADNETVNRAVDSEMQSDDKVGKNLRWTEDMDTCLARILTEKLQKGHITGNILHYGGYEAAVAGLNENFGLGITKDHVKNRLKTWRKQYAVLNELLSHGGFKWDESQMMVSGDDSMWNNYTEMHPEARFFRGKLVHNYYLLLSIFGNSKIMGRRKAYEVDYSLDVNYDSVGVINASPIRCWNSTKEDAKNMRWTNDMDLCLSKVLVWQVKLGNKSKLDNKLNAAAYEAAFLALSERFQLDVTKDHVKNRIKTWKKLYRNIKEILEQRGFEWDKSRNMIIAEDCVWHDYIKINPDARLLHGRVIWNYYDLCVIIGNEDPSGCSANDDQIDLDLDTAAETEFVHENLSCHTSGEEKYFIWSDVMDHFLADRLLGQVKLGNRLEKNLTFVSYAAAVAALSENFALDITTENVKSHLKTWEKVFHLTKELLSTEGFEWDGRTMMVVANDCLWNEYIKRNPDAIALRGRCIRNYRELHAIFSNEHINGYQSHTTGKYETILGFHDIEQSRAPLPIDLETNQAHTSEEDTEDSSHPTGTRPSSSSRSKQPSKKRSNSDIMVEIMRAMAANIARIADALTGNSQPVCLDELFEMVQNIPGFDDDLVIEACEFLSYDEKRAKMFSKLDQRLRKLWLLKRLRAHK